MYYYKFISCIIYKYTFFALIESVVLSFFI